MHMTDRGNAAQRAGNEAKQAGREVQQSKSFDALVTVGLIGYGVVHLLVAWIAVQVAWTGAGQEASQQGAFQEMASTGAGKVLLWVTAIGLFGLVLWQGLEAAIGHRDADDDKKRLVKRIGSAGKAVVYLVLGIGAVRTAAGASSGGNTEQTMTAKLLSNGFGVVLVVAIGIGIAVVGGRLIYRGVTTKFTHDLEGGVSRGIVRLGQVGYIAKGVALGIVGILFMVAAVTADPNKAGGMDTALRTLRNQPAGAVLLTLMALGIAAFGLYCFAWSRHAKKS
jgi:hypothetical protein